MISKATASILFIFLISSTVFGQITDIYIPAGFNNPLLKSGNFITSLYYYNSNTLSEYDDREDKLANYNFNLVGYIGVTDQITLKTIFVYSPAQTYSEITKGGMGEDKSKSYLSPQIVLSYRPSNSIEIFGDFFYQKQTREFGDKSFYQDVPVGVDDQGNIIYEKQLVTQYSAGSSNYRTTAVKIGISYIGNLW